MTLKQIFFIRLLIDEDVLKIKTADVVEKFLPATGHSFQTMHLVGED